MHPQWPSRLKLLSEFGVRLRVCPNGEWIKKLKLGGLFDTLVLGPAFSLYIDLLVCWLLVPNLTELDCVILFFVDKSN